MSERTIKVNNYKYDFLEIASIPFIEIICVKNRNTIRHHCTNKEY